VKVTIVFILLVRLFTIQFFSLFSFLVIIRSGIIIIL